MKTRNRMKNQTGFTLIEVLVSVLILSIGLLGLAMLQVISLKNNQSAEYRTQATMAAYDVIDKLRISGNDAADFSYAVDFYYWNNDLARNLPSGAGTIVVPAGNPDIARVTVTWDDSRGTEGANAQSFVVDVRL